MTLLVHLLQYWLHLSEITDIDYQTDNTNTILGSIIADGVI